MSIIYLHISLIFAQLVKLLTGMYELDFNRHKLPSYNLIFSLNKS